MEYRVNDKVYSFYLQKRLISVRILASPGKGDEVMPKTKSNSNSSQANIKLQHICRLKLENIVDESSEYIHAVILKNHKTLGVTPGEWGLLSYLLAFMNENKNIPSLDEIAENLQTTLSVVRKWRASLNTKGFISLHKYRDEDEPVMVSEYDLTPLLKKAVKIESQKRKYEPIKN